MTAGDGDNPAAIVRDQSNQLPCRLVVDVRYCTESRVEYADLSWFGDNLW